MKVQPLRSIAITVAIIFVIASGAIAQSYAFGTGAFTVGQGPVAVVAADFNSDGLSDVAVASGAGSRFSSEERTEVGRDCRPAR